MQGCVMDMSKDREEAGREASKTPFLFGLQKDADPEERLENAILWKLLKDALGDRLEPHGGGPYGPHATHVFGRIERGRPKRDRGSVRYPGNEGEPAYWTWPAFLANARRSIEVLPYEEAHAAVARVHGRGRDAFVKATVQKSLTMPVPRGSSLSEEMGDLAYSFIDGGPAIIVQESVEMTYEYRIFMIGGVPVTGAGCIESTTPLDHRERIGAPAGFDCAMEATRSGGRAAEPTPEDVARVKGYLAFAERAGVELSAQGAPRCYGLDLCTVDGGIAIVEVNPFHLGQIGLYACDAKRLVAATLNDLGINASTPVLPSGGPRPPAPSTGP